MPDGWAAFVAVALGGALGGAARYAVSGWVARRVGETFPWGTLTVNVLGAFAIGVVAGLAVSGGPLEGQRAALAFAAAGVCGGFTTVSSFTLQTLALARDGEPRLALANVVLSTVACLVAVALGFAAAALAGV